MLENVPTRIREIVREEIDAAALSIGHRVVVNDDTVLNTIKRSTSPIRNAIWWRCREEIMIKGKPISWPQLGYMFERDHTTIMSGVRNHRKPENMVRWSAWKQRFYEAHRRDHMLRAANENSLIQSYG